MFKKEMSKTLAALHKWWQSLSKYFLEVNYLKRRRHVAPHCEHVNKGIHCTLKH